MTQSGNVDATGTVLSDTALSDTVLSGLNVGRLWPWLAEHVPGLDLAAPVVRQISGGRSNLTFEIVCGQRSLVLRRPPLGMTQATAHDMGRECRVLAALAGSTVPVPELLGYCDDETVLGAPFYVMAKVPGLVYRTNDDLAGLDVPAGRRIAYDLVDVLADLHELRYDTVGLADFGKPAGYLERQLRRWAAQSAEVRTRPLPGLAELAADLARLRPGSGKATLVHGDYRLDNVLVSLAEPAVVSVLDWELATLGDPMADLGTFCMYWDGFAGLGLDVPCSPGALPGWPGRDELVARYCARRGIPVAGLGWYVAFGYYRIAVILEGVYRRHERGLTVGDGFGAVGAAVPMIVHRGLSALREN